MSERIQTPVAYGDRNRVRATFLLDVHHQPHPQAGPDGDGLIETDADTHDRSTVTPDGHDGDA